MAQQTEPVDVETDQQMIAAHVEGAECGFRGEGFFDVKLPESGKTAPRELFSGARDFGYVVEYTGQEGGDFVIRFKHNG